MFPSHRLTRNYFQSRAVHSSLKNSHTTRIECAWDSNNLVFFFSIHTKLGITLVETVLTGDLLYKEKAI